MAKLGIIKYFTASHGTKNLHEHNFKVELILEGQIENNMVSGIDFHDVKQILECELDKMSNKYLNDYLNTRATTENIAIYLLKTLRNNNVDSIYSIKLYETEDRYIEIYNSEIN